MITLITPYYAYDYGNKAAPIAVLTLITPKSSRVHARNTHHHRIKTRYARAYILPVISVISVITWVRSVIKSVIKKPEA